jgi:hypothetical protein
MSRIPGVTGRLKYRKKKRDIKQKPACWRTRQFNERDSICSACFMKVSCKLAELRRNR